MKMNRSITATLCRVSAFAFFAASSTVFLHAQQNVTLAELNQPSLFKFNTASAPSSLNLTTEDGVAYSSSVGANDSVSTDSLSFTSSSDALQPPPRRRYGRPNYSDSHQNADGSSKYAFLVGGGLTLPIGNTHKYLTPSYGFQVGGGRNFNKNLSLLLQFDYDHFGFQGNVIAQQNVYYGTTGYGLDGSTHVWSFTLDPVYNFAVSEGIGAYVVAGVGYYHKVANFTIAGTECSYYYGCYTANEPFDDYSSNAIGVNAGFGFTYKFSRFANERLYGEARYVFTDNSQRTGITPTNYTTYAGFNYFPANSNRTTYLPVKFGVRF